MMPYVLKPDPKLDLVLEREIDVPVDLVWKAWTTPSHLRQWFCPKPWTVSDCTIDLRPGGAFVGKVFRGGATGDLLARIKKMFADVKHVKPPASRAESVELYLVATGFRG